MVTKVNVSKRTMLITMFRFSVSSVSSNMVLFYFPWRGGIQRFTFKLRMQNFNKLLQDLGGGRKLEKPKLIASHGRKVPRHLLRAVRFIIVPVLRKLRPVVPHGPSMLRRVLRIAQLMRLGPIICLQVTS